MVIEWREREHEEIDAEMRRDAWGPTRFKNMWPL
jgi:hypothetical protein